MSDRAIQVHIASGDDSLDSLVKDYRLSSVRAILEIEANRHLLEEMPRTGNLPLGMRVNIPPNAIQLVTERARKLEHVRPLFLSHFDALRQIVSANLATALQATDLPLASDDVRNSLAELNEYVDKEILSIASHSAELVVIAEAMSKTHVSEERDHGAVRARHDPLCSLYWALTPEILEQWQLLWAMETWEQLWREKSGEAALERSLQVVNTIGSLVIQQLDNRLRTAHALKESLLAEQ
jgi:hypothetical protein